MAGPDAPSWTDHNDADPGITLLELLAYGLGLLAAGLSVVALRRRCRFRRRARRCRP